jgi:drug/metabolite transporter (DMT)-like permease
MLETTVANVVFILSTAPFFAAALAWILLREPVRPAFWLSLAATLVGLAFMLGGGAVTGSLAGSLLALVSCVGFCGALVAMRERRTVDMLPAACLAGVVTMLISATRSRASSCYAMTS